MANYSQGEIRAFKLKDIMNCRQSALKAATTNNEGKSKKTESLKKEADEYYIWLRQDQDSFIIGEHTNEKVGVGNQAPNNEQQLPEPTLVQKKVLDAISEKAFDGTITIAIKIKVLNWAEEVYGQRSYPTKLDSVDKFINWNNNNK